MFIKLNCIAWEIICPNMMTKKNISFILCRDLLNDRQPIRSPIFRDALASINKSDRHRWESEGPEWRLGDYAHFPGGCRPKPELTEAIPLRAFPSARLVVVSTPYRNIVAINGYRRDCYNSNQTMWNITDK